MKLVNLSHTERAFRTLFKYTERHLWYYFLQIIWREIFLYYAYGHSPNYAISNYEISDIVTL
jgi:hypothetical protein